MRKCKFHKGGYLQHKSKVELSVYTSLFVGASLKQNLVAVLKRRRRFLEGMPKKIDRKKWFSFIPTKTIVTTSPLKAHFYTAWLSGHDSITIIVVKKGWISDKMLIIPYKATGAENSKWKQKNKKTKGCHNEPYLQLCPTCCLMSAENHFIFWLLVCISIFFCIVFFFIIIWYIWPL